MSPKLTEKEIHTAFIKFDKNGDGTMDKDEVIKFLKSIDLKIPKKQLKQMMAEADKSGDGKINFQEFMGLAKDALYGEEDLYQAFKEYDTSGDGKIDKKELLSLFNQLGEDMTEADIEEMMGYVDENNDGTFTYEEFKLLMED